MATTRWLDGSESRAWRSFLQMQAQLFARLGRQLQRDDGLSEADYAVLVNLTESPGGRLRPFELGRATQWEKSRLSHHLTRMADRGLVVREACPTDSRGAVIVVSDAGRAAIAAAAPRHVDQVRRWFIDALTPEQLAALADVSETVLAHLAADPDSDGC
jgi:DNA-binding MarR family transcriptional regulator